MGFSVSASTAVVFIGLLVSVGMVYTTGTNVTERVLDAQGDASERRLDRQNTDLAVTNATYFEGNGTLVLRAENRGATGLGVNATDVVLDNALLVNATGTTDLVAGDGLAAVGQPTVAVDGDTGTDLWLPGETLRVEVALTAAPSRAALSTDGGVADTEVVA